MLMLPSVRVSPVESCSRTTTVFDKALPGCHPCSPSGSVFPLFPALQAELGKHCPYSSRPLPLTFHTLRSCFQLCVSTLANEEQLFSRQHLDTAPYIHLQHRGSAGVRHQQSGAQLQAPSALGSPFRSNVQYRPQTSWLFARTE